MIICPCASMIDAAHVVNRFFSAKAKFFLGLGRGGLTEILMAEEIGRGVVRLARGVD